MNEPFRDKVIRKCGESMALRRTRGHGYGLHYALQAAREKQLLTIAFAGKDGGRFPEEHIVWDLVHIALGEEDVT